MDMSSVELAYGQEKLKLATQRQSQSCFGSAAERGERSDQASLLREALAQPIGSARIRDLAKPGQQVVIVTSDLTRPCPSERLLPPVLDELAAAGVSDGDVTIVAALGLHRPMTEAELETAVGAGIYSRLRVVNHDATDTVRLGVTSAGTPVEILPPSR